MMSECAPCGLKIALCELTCVVKLFIVAEEEVVEAGGGVAEGGGVECCEDDDFLEDFLSFFEAVFFKIPLVSCVGEYISTLTSSSESV